MAEHDSDDDNVPLAILMRQNEDEDDVVPLIQLQRKLKSSDDVTNDQSSDECYDSDKDPEFNIGVCEVESCKKEVWAACHRCEIFVCFDHFNEDITSCSQHGNTMKRKKRDKKKTVQPSASEFAPTERKRKLSEDFNTHQSSDECYNSDKDTEFNIGVCEVKSCKEEVWAACHRCEILVCFDHFNEDITSCSQHGNTMKRKKRDMKTIHSIASEVATIEKQPQTMTGSSCGVLDKLPEHFTVEGNEKEACARKSPKKNKQKEAKLKRNTGQEYISPNTKKTVPAKSLKPRCNGSAKCGRKCDTISDEQRKEIFDSFHAIGDIGLQREFIVRHIEITDVQRRKKDSEDNPRRDITKKYFLTANGQVQVCQKMFLNTLSVSEQVTRTALSKVTSTGTVEKDKRGGRQSEKVKERDNIIKKAVCDHINRFPRVESHYCRADTARQYLHSDLTKQKMYEMFCKEWSPRPNPPCFRYYGDTVDAMQLSIHRPKKDQCSLCATVLNAKKVGGSISDQLSTRYEQHIAEKVKVRELKNSSKLRAQNHQKIVKCATFDLQQVIYLPKSLESALFYKRRLSNYNLTFYDVVSKECHCFTWHEGVSKRGSSEISTAVYKALKLYDDDGAEEIHLYSDGCAGQNKNSIMPAMMLYAVENSKNLQEVSLRYFESFHGQNEGDSVHSAISTAMKQTGNLFIPSQLVPVFALARRHNTVHQLQFDDFVDFKALSQDLRILNSRKESEDGFVLWNNIMELKVVRGCPDRILYKTSHLAESYSQISLKRTKKSVAGYELKQLNTEPNKLSKDKYEDLVSLCSGETPVVRNQEHKDFYLNLPHL